MFLLVFPNPFLDHCFKIKNTTGCFIDSKQAKIFLFDLWNLIT